MCVCVSVQACFEEVDKCMGVHVHLEVEGPPLVSLLRNAVYLTLGWALSFTRSMPSELGWLGPVDWPISASSVLRFQA